MLSGVRPLIGSVKYNHLGSKVIDEEISGDRATIVLDARIYAIVGSAKQKEHYEPKKIDGKWLINGVAVKEEEIEETPYLSVKACKTHPSSKGYTPFASLSPTSLIYDWDFLFRK